MKNILLLLLVANMSLAQKSGGIQFKSATVESVFQDARRAGKPVFVEIYSPTCHTCQSFMPTLADSRVGKFYNDKFVNTKLDIAQPATRAFLDSRHLLVPSLPTFLYFDPQQNLIHFALSTNSTDEVIRHGTNALNPKVRSQTMKSRYQQGERSTNFLIDYAMYARITNDTLAGITAMNDYAKQQSPATFANQTNWLALQKLVLDFENPMAQYMISHMDTYRKAYGADQAKKVAEDILMSSLYSRRGEQFPVAKILEIRQDLVKIGLDSKVVANRTLLPEVKAYFRARQTAKAVERMDNQVNSNQMTVPEYLYISRLFNRNSPDAVDAPTVAKWINKALAQKPGQKEQASLYFELSEAYRRGGKSADAQKAAQRATELSQTS